MFTCKLSKLAKDEVKASSIVVRFFNYSGEEVAVLINDTLKFRTSRTKLASHEIWRAMESYPLLTYLTTTALKFTLVDKHGVKINPKR